ncbi:MAG TPA: molybdate ABC transporter substrate-binding protein [Pseudolysinimonas sp.]|jgi:molybdate transport system substrate-binding protein|nr:molybdate ABC transporter substrate-binding protein [Pseudolysinimonas sp.]
MARSTRVTLAAAAGVVLLAGCAGPAPSTDDPLTGTVTVFAAASLTDTFDAVAAEFEAAHPHVDVTVNYGGSSGLAAQIVGGAPADVFAAANEATMQTVVDAGAAADPAIFARNTLVLVVPAGNPGEVTGLADLSRPELAVALCDPAVPCGSAALQLLDIAGVAAAADTLEQDVRGVLTRVELGEADAGLVYATDAAAAGPAVDVIAVPQAEEVVNRYPIAVLTGAPNPDAARAFVDAVLSSAGRRLLADAGFMAP